jgi:hypothetical protein
MGVAGETSASDPLTGSARTRPPARGAPAATRCALPVGTWESRTERGARHLGPTAQDFRAAFGLGSDARSIAVLDASGVALAAARALEARSRALQAENAAPRRRHDEVSERVARLEQALAPLAAQHDQRR